jgi:hypothetical protein
MATDPPASRLKLIESFISPWGLPPSQTPPHPGRRAQPGSTTTQGRPYEFRGFGDLDGPKLYCFIGFEMHPKHWSSICFMNRCGAPGPGPKAPGPGPGAPGRFPVPELPGHNRQLPDTRRGLFKASRRLHKASMDSLHVVRYLIYAAKRRRL